MATTMAPPTHKIKSAVQCSVNKVGAIRCTNRAWELCDKCDRPACGQHVLAHYRLFHPRCL